MGRVNSGSPADRPRGRAGEGRSMGCSCGPGQGMGPPVHRGPASRARLAGGGGVVRGGGTKAAVLRLAVATLRGTRGCAEGTGVPRMPRRARCACWPCEGEAEEDEPRGGAVRRRRWNYGELVRAAERGREGEKGTDAILTSLRSSGKCSRCRGPADS